MRFRRHKYEPKAPLDESWVIKSDNETPNNSEGSNLPTSRVFQRLANRDNGFEQKRETAIDRSTRGGISIASAESIHLSQTSGDSASEHSRHSQSTTQSKITTGSSSGRFRKKRYAKQHQAEWLQEDVGKAEQAVAKTEPQQTANSGQVSPSNKTTRAPLSDSPSIFNLPASFEGKQGCDAPPICPQIPPHYSPPDVRLL
jgi:hypothetical protein